MEDDSKDRTASDGEDEDRLAALMKPRDRPLPSAEPSPPMEVDQKHHQSRSPLRMADSWVSPDLMGEGRRRERGTRRDSLEVFESWVAEPGRYEGWTRDRETQLWMPPQSRSKRGSPRDNELRSARRRADNHGTVGDRDHNRDTRQDSRRPSRQFRRASQSRSPRRRGREDSGIRAEPMGGSELYLRVSDRERE